LSSAASARAGERHSGSLRGGLLGFPLPFSMPEITLSTRWHAELEPMPQVGGCMDAASGNKCARRMCRWPGLAAQQVLIAAENAVSALRPAALHLETAVAQSHVHSDA